MTEASWCIYTQIYPLIGPATNHCPENGLSHLQIMERPNVHIISLQLVIHYYTCEHCGRPIHSALCHIEAMSFVNYYTCEHWLIAIEPYNRISTLTIRWWGFSNAEALGNVEYLFIAITPRSTLSLRGSTW